MSRTDETWSELQALKNDLIHALNAKAETFRQSSGLHFDRFSDQIASSLDELSGAMEEGEDQLERVVSEHPIAAVLSAFAVGVIVGLSLRRLL